MPERIDGHPARFFSPDYGLMAARAADAVLQALPLRFGPDGAFWAYRDGLWSPSEEHLHRAIVRLLGDRYRPHHATAIRDVLRAEVEPVAVAPVGRFINLRSGLLVWQGVPGPYLVEHHPDSESTVQLPLEWDPDAACPDFEAFIDHSIDADDRERVWEILGYMMMSGNPLQRMFLLTGGGGNGKGVFLHVLSALLGSSNIAAVPLHDFIDDRFAPADLYGKLANICGDIDTTFIESTGKIKTLAGEDLIRAEHKYGRSFRFEFWGKAIFSANGIPASADSSHGWTRRWEVVTFPHAPAKPDSGLVKRLTAPESLRGIARRAIEALRNVMARGNFAHGHSATKAHKEFAQKSNKVLAWIDDQCVIAGTKWHSRTELVSAFRRWDAYNNPAARAMGTHEFYGRLRAIKGLTEVKNGTWGFRGLMFESEIAYGEVIEASPNAEPESALDGQGTFDGM